ncbi:MAG: hypothetical protein SFU83_18855 [Meiothermus sp.]|nr:hypothetical protein [Meiothermus sp.]
MATYQALLEHYKTLLREKKTPVEVARVLKQENIGPLESIKLVRELFDLSFVEAKEAITIGHGYANSLSEYQEKHIFPALDFLALVEESKQYSYVGSPDRLTLDPPADLTEVYEKSDFALWAKRNGWTIKPNLEVITTFILDTQAVLWIADRRSEHVACAKGKPVLAAGELTLEWMDGEPAITQITNQSTGYCPEFSCWSVLEAALKIVEVRFPLHFTAEFEFRRCDHCQAINVIKNGVFECLECGSKLSSSWNF